MLGGLIAGAMGGGASAVTSLADQAIEEAKQAKKNAYEKGILEWKVGVDAEAATTASERELGRTVLSSQLAGEQQAAQNIFTAGENEKTRKSQLRAAEISASRSNRITASEEAQALLLQMKKDYKAATDPEERKKLAEEISFFEGRTPAKQDYITVKNDVGGETAYIKTPNGLVQAPILGGAEPVGSQLGKNKVPLNPAFDETYKAFFGIEQQQSDGRTPVQPKPATQTPNLSSDPQNVKRLYNEGIKNAMNEIQKQIPLASTDQQRMQLSAKYSELQSTLKK